MNSAEQQKAFTKHERKMFLSDINTATNKEKAEKYALKMSSEDLPEIHWASNPQEAEEKQKFLIGSLVCKLLQEKREACITEEGLADKIFNNNVKDIVCNGVIRCNYLTASDGKDNYDIGWISYCASLEKVGLVAYDEELSKEFKYFKKLMKYCFSIIAFPGHIILTERPKKVTVKDNNEIFIEF